MRIVPLDPPNVPKNILSPSSMRHSAPRAQQYVYTPFIKENIEEAGGVAPAGWNRTISDSPYLFQKKLAIEIHSSVGERLSELSTPRGSSPAKAGAFIFHSRHLHSMISHPLLLIGSSHLRCRLPSICLVHSSTPISLLLLPESRLTCW